MKKQYFYLLSVSKGNELTNAFHHHFIPFQFYQILSGNPKLADNKSSLGLHSVYIHLDQLFTRTP